VSERAKEEAMQLQFPAERDGNRQWQRQRQTNTQAKWKKERIQIEVMSDVLAANSFLYSQNLFRHLNANAHKTGIHTRMQLR